MPKISELTGRKVLVAKKPKKEKDGGLTERFGKLGKVHMAVFSPNGKRVVGLMVHRPDVVGMVKREDAFLALDSFALQGKDLVVTREGDGLDAAARKRLQIDWDRCIMWAGMDVKTADGKPLGYVTDAEFDLATGTVTRFFSTDGGVAHALIGSFVLTPDLVRGYKDGCMIVDAEGGTPVLDGGVAAAAGEGYARAKAGAAAAGKAAGQAAGKAVDKGSFALGKLIGKAQRAISEATADEDEAQAAPEVPAVAAADVRVEKPTCGLPTEASAPRPASERPAPKTYAPVSSGEKPVRAAGDGAAKKAAAGTAAKKAPAGSAAKKPASGSQTAARAVGKQLGGFGKMFGSFADEFKKASK